MEYKTFDPTGGGDETPDFTCGMCAYWYGGKCHNEESLHNMAKRKGGAPACDLYTEQFHSTAWLIKDWIMHHKVIIGGGVAVLVFLGIWLVTGDILAAWILMEFIFELLMEMDF